MKNLYKRSDVFLCSNRSHASFEKRVSVYHVLKAKKCYPGGCVYFYWKCKKLNKGESCPRRYEHVGRNCFGCREFYDLKVSNQLKLALQPDEWTQFQEELAEFEEWLAEIQGKTLPIFGEIQNIKPYCTSASFPANGKLHWQGMMLTFRDCYIGRTHFEDFAYALISSRLFEKHRFSPGDRLDFLAQVELDLGRLVFRRLSRIEFSEHQVNADWQLRDIPATLALATKLNTQSEKCYRCPKGVLVDVMEPGKRLPTGRELYCLEGIVRPADCLLTASALENLELCANDQR